MNVAALKITRVFAGGRSEEKDLLSVTEHALEIFVNGKKTASLVCTPTNLLELVAGRLLTLGFIEEKSEIAEINFCESKHRAFVTLLHQIPLEEKTDTELTCCTSNHQLAMNSSISELPILEKAKWNKEEIFALAKEFSKGTVVHTHTAGTHSCILAVDGKPVFTAEDIGRHNALDKAAGYMLLNDLPCERSIVFTSGRVPVDMVEKTIRARIPVLVAKSVPTAQSAELARKHNLTLICRAWEDSFDIVND